jgi:hypothetical protein
MTAENFCYWLQGYFELYGPKTLDEKETRVVWDHLNLVFQKQTPNRSEDLNKMILDAVKNGPQETRLNDYVYLDALKRWNESNPNKPLIC